MKTINPIQSNERLVASGVYHYLLGRRDTLIRESWTIHQHGEEEIIRVERDAAAFQSNLLSEIYRKDGRIIGQEIRWENQNPKHVQKASASYKLNENRLLIERSIEGKAYEETIEMNNFIILASLMRITIGIVLKQLLTFPSGTEVIVPNILRADDKQNLLSAHLEKRQTKLLSTEPIEAGGKLYQAQCYSYTGDLYDDEARFWLDKYGILLRYTWKQSDGMAWDVHLNDYQRST